MGLGNIIKKAFASARTIPGSIFGLSWTRGGGNSSGTEPSDKDLEDAIPKNPILFSCVKLLTDAMIEGVPRVGRWTEDGWEDLETDEGRQYANLIMKPNQLMTRYDFLFALYQNRVSTGRGYIWINRNGFSEAGELWPIPTSWVKQVASTSPDEYIAGYQISIPGKGAFDVTPEDMMDFGYIDARDPTKALSPVRSVWSSLSIDTALNDYVEENLRNNQMPGLAVMQEDGWTDAQRAMVREVFQMDHGYGKRGSPIFLSGKGADIKGLPTIGDQGQPVLTSIQEARICMAVGVPTILIHSYSGLAHSTYANYEAAQRDFVRNTVLPNWTQLGEELTHLLPENLRSEGYEIYFDTASVKALQSDSKAEADRAVVIFSGGIASLNEAREIAGLEPVSGPQGDFYSRNFNASFEAIDAVTDTPDSLTPADHMQATEGESAENDPATGTPLAAETISDTAMNGAQLSEARTTVESVAAGLLPAVSAIELLSGAFALWSRERIERMVGAAEEQANRRDTQTPAEPASEPVAEPEPENARE